MGICNNIIWYFLYLFVSLFTSEFIQVSKSYKWVGKCTLANIITTKCNDIWWRRYNHFMQSQMNYSTAWVNSCICYGCLCWRAIRTCVTHNHQETVISSSEEMPQVGATVDVWASVFYRPNLWTDRIHFLSLSTSLCGECHVHIMSSSFAIFNWGEFFITSSSEYTLFVHRRIWGDNTWNIWIPAISLLPCYLS